MSIHDKMKEMAEALERSRDEYAKTLKDGKQSLVACAVGRIQAYRDSLTKFAEGIRALKDDIARQECDRERGIERVRKLEQAGVIPAEEQLAEILKEVR